MFKLILLFSLFLSAVSDEEDGPENPIYLVQSEDIDTLTLNDLYNLSLYSHNQRLEPGTILASEKFVYIQGYDCLMTHNRNNVKIIKILKYTNCQNMKTYYISFDEFNSCAR